MYFWKKKLKKWLTDDRILEIPFDNKDKFILFSDLHRGVNDWSDDFAHNESLYFHALGQYLEDGFTCIELGDSDELWENRKFDDIRYQHRHIFWRLKEFHDVKRYHMIYGNHDNVRKRAYKVRKTLHYFRKRSDEYFEKKYLKNAQGDLLELFKDFKAHEAIRLRYKPKNKILLLIHGHQADWFTYHFWWIARFFVRYVWKFLQNIGIKDQTSPAKNHKKAEKLDKKLAKWNEDKECRLIAGHTHNPRLLKDSNYVNTGCCVHPRCITGIKIENGTLNMVKWWITTQDNSNALCVEEEYLVKGVAI
jgi:predicted phosphodiesterase